MPGQPTSGRICQAVARGYGPYRLVADAIAAMAAHGVCPVFTARDLPRALAGCTGDPHRAAPAHHRGDPGALPPGRR